MKPKILFPLVLLAFVLSGCFVFSFYPLYTDQDLFPNRRVDRQGLGVVAFCAPAGY